MYKENIFVKRRKNKKIFLIKEINIFIKISELIKDYLFIHERKSLC